MAFQPEVKIRFLFQHLSFLAWLQGFHLVKAPQHGIGFS